MEKYKSVLVSKSVELSFGRIITSTISEAAVLILLMGVSYEVYH
jgi:molybdopterin-binding protein